MVCPFPADLHLECTEKATPFSIRIDAGDIHITPQRPGQQNTVNLPAGCELDITFEADDAGTDPEEAHGSGDGRISGVECIAQKLKFAI